MVDKKTTTKPVVKEETTETKPVVKEEVIAKTPTLADLVKSNQARTMKARQAALALAEKRAKGAK